MVGCGDSLMTAAVYGAGRGDVGPSNSFSKAVGRIGRWVGGPMANTAAASDRNFTIDSLRVHGVKTSDSMTNRELRFMLDEIIAGATK